MNEIVLWIGVRADERTAERAIVASSVVNEFEVVSETK